MQKAYTVFLNMAIAFRKFALFLSIFLPKHFRILKRNVHENSYAASLFGFQKFQFLGQRSDLENQVLIFNAERVLLRSSSLFPYFMLVAFEAGSLLRALILFILYPFISLCRKHIALNVMVMVCFLGLKKERFIEGRAVLPKFFLGDVGRESFEVLRRGKITVALSDLPQVMVESFLVDYLDIDVVVGRDLKVFCGYFVGLMEERRDINAFQVVKMTPNVIGIDCFRKCSDCKWFSICKEIYLVSEQEKRNWHQLPRHLYPKPFIFHDGRLAFRPTFLGTLAMFMWLPMGFSLAVIRGMVALALPFEITCPILHFSGAKMITTTFNNNPKSFQEKLGNKGNGVLYVCNHRTLLDPLLISYCLRTPLTAVVYSVSRMSEILAPIKTVRLTRNRERDAELMHELLRKDNLVVCPEGTTCREPYLLRFSPLFTEISNDIYPVAIDCQVSMFYGTTARGFKCLDPLFLLMNPRPTFSVRFLDMVRGGEVDENRDDGEASKYKTANLVQNVIAKELGFTCTRLTRKDKYLILAGNEGVVQYAGKI